MLRLLITLIAIVSSSAYGQFYTGASAGFFNSRDLKSWGGGARAGYELAPLNHWVHQGIECEFLAIHGHAYAQDSRLTPMGKSLESAKLTVTQVPLLVNYRLWGKAMDHLPISWYLGIGAGLQWMKSHYHREASGVNNAGGVVSSNQICQLWAAGNPNCRGTVDNHRTDILPVVQCFVGLGYDINDHLTATLGTRLMATKSKSWNDGTKTPCEINTGTFQLGVEIGLNYTF